jgi:hypothetical protein
VTDADIEATPDYDADEDDIMISSRPPAGSQHDKGDRRPTKSVGKDPMDNSVNIGESGSPTAPITAKTPFVKPHAIPGQPRAQESSEQRAGRRISAESMGAVHGLRDGAMEQVRAACAHCGCEQCQAELAAMDAVAANANEPQELARSVALFGQSRVLTALFERAVEERLQSALASILESVEQRFNDLDLTLADSLAEQQRRDARTPDPTALSAEYTRALPSHVTAAVTQAAAPITQRLDTLAASVAGVKGDVERIANQPMTNAPMAWSGIADKVLPGSPPYARRTAESDLSVEQRIAVLQDMAQRSTNSSVQSELAAEILQIQRSEGGGLPPIPRLAGGRY